MDPAGACWAGTALLLMLVSSVGGAAPRQSATDAADAGKNRILLVLPFDNRTGQPSLEWIREAAPEILSSRFASAGFAPMSRADRMYALDHLGLPQRFQPSRASALKLAQTLDADSIMVGSYRDGGHGDCGRGARARCAAFAHERPGDGARRDARPDRRIRLAGVEADANYGSRVQRGPGDISRCRSKVCAWMPLSSTFAGLQSRTSRSASAI